MITGLIRGRRLPLILVAVLSLLLSACAVLDTKLTINADGSGSRVLVGTVPASDFEGETFTPDIVDALIKETVPDALTYGGMTTDPEGNSVYTFTLEFTDAADYESKVVTLLAAGELYDLAADVTIDIHDDTFGKGFRVEENFSSDQLVQWLAMAMTAKGYLSESDASGMFETGTSTVTFGETTTEVYQPISHEDLDDRRISGVSVTTAMAEDGTFTRSIAYDIPREIHAANPEGFEEFLSSVTPEGGELTPPGDTDTIWTVTFPPGSADDVGSWTNAALMSEGTQFATSESFNGETLSRELTVLDMVECAHICQESATPVSKLTVPALWEDLNSTMSYEDGEEQTRTYLLPEWYDGDRKVTLSSPISFTGVNVETLLEAKGESHLTIDVDVPTADAELASDALRGMLDPGTNGELRDAAKDGTTTYTVSFKADSAAALHSKVSEYLPNSTFEAYAGKSGMLTKHDSATVSFGLPYDWRVNGPVRVVLGLPRGSKATDTSLGELATTVDGNEIVVEDAGTSWVELSAYGESTRWGMVLMLVGLGLLVAAAIAFGVWSLRRRDRGDDPTAGPVPPPGPQGPLPRQQPLSQPTAIEPTAGLSGPWPSGQPSAPRPPQNQPGSYPSGPRADGQPPQR